MTLRTPLYDDSGTPTEIGAGDYLESDIGLTTLVNNSGGDLVKCTPVYSASSNNMAKAKADARETSKVVGLVADPTVLNTATGPVQACGVITANTAEWCAVTGEPAGLTAGDTYYLDPTTAGRLTKTVPVSTGFLWAPIGKALSATELNLNISAPILL